MKCKCKNVMNTITNEYSGNEDLMGTWYWCCACGRAKYHSIDSHGLEDPSKDSWLTPACTLNDEVLHCVDRLNETDNLEPTHKYPEDLIS